MNASASLVWQYGGGVYISDGQVTFQSSNIYSNQASVRTCPFLAFQGPVELTLLLVSCHIIIYCSSSSIQ